MDNSRRNFLKVIFMGSSVWIAGKILGPALSRFLDTRAVVKKDFKNFLRFLRNF